MAETQAFCFCPFLLIYCYFYTAGLSTRSFSFNKCISNVDFTSNEDDV